MNTSVENRKAIASHPKTEMTEKYQFLVARIADQKFKDMSVPREKLEEVGYIGLLNAVNLYDKRIHKMNFHTYARIMIKAEMHQYLVNQSIRESCPDWLLELNQKINDFVIQFREKNKRFPQISEIVFHLNINPLGLQEVLKARDALQETYFGYNIDKYNDRQEIQPELEKIKSQTYQSFRLPIEDIITLKKALRRLKI